MENSVDRGLKFLSAEASKKNKIAPWAVGVFTFVGIITVMVICAHNFLVIYLWYSSKRKSKPGKAIDPEAAKNAGGKPLAASAAPAAPAKAAPQKADPKTGKTADPKTNKETDPKTNKETDPKTIKETDAKTVKKTDTKTVQKPPGSGVAKTYIHIFVPVGERWEMRQHRLGDPFPAAWRHFNPNKPNSLLYPRNKKGKGPDPAPPSVKLSEFGNVDAKSALKEKQKHLTLEEEKQIVKKEKPPADYAEFLNRAEEQYANLKSDAKEDMRPSVLLLHYVENQETKQKAKKKGEVVKEKTESAAEESALNKKKTELVKPKTKTKVVEDKTESVVDQSVLNKEKKHTKTKTKVVEEKSAEEQSMTEPEPEPVKPQKKKTKVPAESQESAAEKSFESKETERLKTKVKKPGKASKGKIKPDKKQSKAGKKTKGKKSTAENTQSSASDDN
ncbi:unnamed protein product [Bursaphelenchus xylophilus]|uniref:(pine wood nematode) hypothetical protein n=1 Tax=Bursaphelenchus xylophilus TaxID=6326 RepID=A0A1I7SAS9_BURXY|nr:unnamed protein product [Bursaphelenchus xylophilus]CAG9126804.1 unnamed protein product [Bursaphelenchus xylophilus]